MEENGACEPGVGATIEGSRRAHAKSNEFCVLILIFAWLTWVRFIQKLAETASSKQCGEFSWKCKAPQGNPDFSLIFCKVPGRLYCLLLFPARDAPASRVSCSRDTLPFLENFKIEKSTKNREVFPKIQGYVTTWPNARRSLLNGWLLRDDFSRRFREVPGIHYRPPPLRSTLEVHPWGQAEKQWFSWVLFNREALRRVYIPCGFIEFRVWGLGFGV